MVSENWNAFWTFGASKSVFEHRNTSRSIKNAMAYQDASELGASKRLREYRNAFRGIKTRLRASKCVLKHRNAFCSIGTRYQSRLPVARSTHYTVALGTASWITERVRIMKRVTDHHNKRVRVRLASNHVAEPAVQRRTAPRSIETCILRHC